MVGAQGELPDASASTCASMAPSIHLPVRAAAERGPLRSALEAPALPPHLDSGGVNAPGEQSLAKRLAALAGREDATAARVFYQSRLAVVHITSAASDSAWLSWRRGVVGRRNEGGAPESGLGPRAEVHAPYPHALFSLLEAERGSPDEWMVRGSGTGFVFDRHWHIVTNAHVVAGASHHWVRFGTGERVAATVLGVDDERDVAVLALREDAAPRVRHRPSVLAGAHPHQRHRVRGGARGACAPHRRVAHVWPAADGRGPQRWQLGRSAVGHARPGGGRQLRHRQSERGVCGHRFRHTHRHRPPHRGGDPATWPRHPTGTGSDVCARRHNPSAGHRAWRADPACAPGRAGRACRSARHRQRHQGGAVHRRGAVRRRDRVHGRDGGERLHRRGAAVAGQGGGRYGDADGDTRHRADTVVTGARRGRGGIERIVESTTGAGVGLGGVGRYTAAAAGRQGQVVSDAVPA
eukprot:ctg_934.g359